MKHHRVGLIGVPRGPTLRAESEAMKLPPTPPPTVTPGPTLRAESEAMKHLDTQHLGEDDSPTLRAESEAMKPRRRVQSTRPAVRRLEPNQRR